MPFGQDQDPNNNNKTGDDQDPNSKTDDQSGNNHQDQNNDDPNRAFMIIGDRAFRTQEDVVKKIEHADSHIQTLEAERAAEQEQLAKLRAENEELLKFKEGVGGRQETGNATQTEQLSKEEIVKHAASLVMETIESNKTQQEKTINLSQAESMAKEAYGDDWNKAVVEAGSRLGMTADQINALGEDSPEAFKRLFIPADAGKPNEPTRSNTHFDERNRQQDNQDTKPVNITKMRKESDRIAEVSKRMKAAGVPGY